MFLVFGMIVCTIGEMLLLPAIPTFFSERTGKSAPFYMGLSDGFGNVGRMTRPTIYGNVYDHWGRPAGDCDRDPHFSRFAIVFFDARFAAQTK
ncbi:MULTISPECIES: hypothetical protein [unclassified Paenibacillus]|uniref:hypothetical protein n=1 Tax=unclassified Paenibacillus TaxID=185978 RepID=UPI0021179361|nr:MULTISPECIES: hypothetical protein [unclassified Paenibacillus]